MDFFFILLDMELILLHFIPRAELNMGFGDIDILKKEKQDNALQIEHLKRCPPHLQYISWKGDRLTSNIYLGKVAALP